MINDCTPQQDVDLTQVPDVNISIIANGLIADMRNNPHLLEAFDRYEAETGKAVYAGKPVGWRRPAGAKLI
jgi:hypothetical protein